MEIVKSVERMLGFSPNRNRRLFSHNELHENSLMTDWGREQLQSYTFLLACAIIIFRDFRSTSNWNRFRI